MRVLKGHRVIPQTKNQGRTRQALMLNNSAPVNLKTYLTFPPHSRLSFRCETATAGKEATTGLIAFNGWQQSEGSERWPILRSDSLGLL